VDRRLSPLSAGTDGPAVHLQTPDEYLQLGIKHHEANRLEESALCFERSAKEQGGCGIGMLMYGLTLRHGWGCPRNEKSGFHWLKKAAELAVTDLEKGKQGVDATVIRVSSSRNNVSSYSFKGFRVVRTHPRDIRGRTEFLSRLGGHQRQEDGSCAFAGLPKCLILTNLRVISKLRPTWVTRTHNKALHFVSRMGKGVRKIERRRLSGIVQRCVPRPRWRTTRENNIF
jgi:hypothetical protein